MTPEREAHLRKCVEMFGADNSFGVAECLAEIDRLRAKLNVAQDEAKNQQQAANHWFKEGNNEHNENCRLRARIADLEAVLSDAKALISAAVLGSVLGLKPLSHAEAEVNRVVDRINTLLGHSATRIEA